MNYEDRDSYGIYKGDAHKGPEPRLMGADTPVGDDGFNRNGKDKGDVKKIMLDTASGNVRYAVVSYGGFFPGMGDKLSVPRRRRHYATNVLVGY